LKFDAIPELVGNNMFPDSMAMVQRGGRLCLAGFLDRLALIKRLQSSPRSRQWSAFQLLKACSPPSVLPR
jgi:NADPH:quinone reductase-like Zn-dependent oxidoreductase